MQDTHRFEATSVSCFSENNTDIIGLSDDDDEPEHFVVLMQLREKDVPFELSLALQTEGMERPVTQAMQAIQLSRWQMNIKLSVELKNLLGYGTIEVGLPERHEHPLLEQYLKLCLDGTPIVMAIEQ